MNRLSFFKVSLLFVFLIFSFGFFIVRLLVTSPDFYLILNEDFSISSDIVNFFNYDSLDSSKYLEIEIVHMNDVLDLLDFWFMVFIVCFVLFLLVLYFCSYRDILIGFRISLLFFVVLFFLMIVFFDRAFYLFHRVFFSQGGWVFPYESIIIQNMPFVFFLRGLIFVLVFVFLFVFFLRRLIDFKKNTTSL
ncbi:MAG: DUF1461 domain-containing protein [Candidatus Nanoarchaeia archaeon]|nr:DUF1461 domain-containing protein [Candidatus Nanoarchaeia archaeon]